MPILVVVRYTHKKSVALAYVFIGIFVVFDYLSTQLQRTKPTPCGGCSAALLRVEFEVVEVSKIPEFGYFAFSYSVMCILIVVYCFIGSCFGEYGGGLICYL